MSSRDLASRPFDVVGLGVNALDLIAIIDGYPQPDTKVQFQTFDVQGGGVVATAMAACARLGLTTRYIGKVGGDFWSHASIKTLTREGIDVRYVIRDKSSPGHVSLVLADRATGQRTLFFRRPPAYAIGPEELQREAITSGRLLHVDGIDAAAALQAVEWARERGAFWKMHDTLFENPYAADPESLVELATQLGLDGAGLAAALKSEKYVPRVRGSMAEAKAAGITGTPTLFFNGRRHLGPSFS